MWLLVYILTYGAAFLGLCVVAAYLYFTRKFGHWRKKGVKYLKPTPFVGNLKDVVFMRKNIGMVTKDIYEQHKDEPYLGLYAFDEPVLQIHDLDLVKAVLVKDSQVFSDRSLQANENTDSLSAKNLFRLKGDRWKQSRNSISPSFSSGKVKGMYDLVAQCGDSLLNTIERENCAEMPIPVYELAARYTTDVIASCAFGIQGNNLADPNDEMRRNLQITFEFTPLRALLMAASFLAPNLVKLFGFKVIRTEAENYVRNIIHSVIKEREEHQIKKNDLLDHLIELKNSSSNSDAKEKSTLQTENVLPFDEEDICGHSFTFFNAGFETAANTIHFAIYELAMNQNVQDNLRKEIQKVPMEEMSYETLHDMQYLDKVMRETLRKYPPLSFLDRISDRPYTLPGTHITLEKGTRVIIPNLALQMDPKYYLNPKHFDPERFSEDIKKNIPNHTYLPFGEGPRYCVGMRFAVMEMKSAIAHIIRNYSVHPCSSTPPEIHFNPKIFLLHPKDDILLIFKPLE